MRSCVVFRQMTYCIRILLGLNASEQRMMCDAVDQFSVTALKVDVRSSYDRRRWLDQFWQENFWRLSQYETKLSRKRGEMKAIQRQRGHHQKASKSVSRGSHSPFKQIVYQGWFVACCKYGWGENSLRVPTFWEEEQLQLRYKQTDGGGGGPLPCRLTTPSSPSPSTLGTLNVASNLPNWLRSAAPRSSTRAHLSGRDRSRALRPSEETITITTAATFN